ncbi:sel1 repeat family protein [Acetobacteraceae bacterium H6797]|nr:sel1 repeat family protein [Acetobacteraceae bacterium H6797]
MSEARILPDEALMALGQVHLDNGRPKEAYECFRDAARGGRPAALNMLGRCHERGWGVRRDPALARQCFTRAADLGDAWAMFNLADLLARGEGGPKDAEGAYRLYAEAARRGNGKALNMLGLFHEEGEVVPPDRMAAMAFYEAAAEAGDCWGAFNLARLMIDAGRTEAALSWLDRALETGFADFFRMMAEMLETHPDPRILARGRAARARL